MPTTVRRDDFSEERAIKCPCGATLKPFICNEKNKTIVNRPVFTPLILNDDESIVFAFDSDDVQSNFNLETPKHGVRVYKCTYWRFGKCKSGAQSLCG